MPEGHTVHRLANAFNGVFRGSRVAASSPQGRFAEGAAALDGRVLAGAEACGKQMFLHFGDDVWVRVHLGLYGMWRFAGPGLEGFGRRRGKAAAEEGWPPAPRGAVRLRLVAERHVADLSGPTACAVTDGFGRTAALARLGEDPLREDAEPERAFAKIKASRTAIGALLMRQDIVAGIGNIYRAEVLFRARLEPHRAGRELDTGLWGALWTDLAELMRDGVRTGRIVTTGRRRRGESVWVSHRAGKPCLVCGSPVLAEPMAGRTLYWCGVCQVE